MYNIKEIALLRGKCKSLKLEGSERLDFHSDAELQKICNGIGPQFFPEWLRKAVTALHPTLAPAAFIHDVEYEESDGSLSGFTAANDRFKRNGYKLAEEAFGWYDVRRYIVMNQARRFGNLCQAGGWIAWVKGAKK